MSFGTFTIQTILDRIEVYWLQISDNIIVVSA